jgi:hypothetical protein
MGRRHEVWAVIRARVAGCGGGEHALASDLPPDAHIPVVACPTTDEFYDKTSCEVDSAGRGNGCVFSYEDVTSSFGGASRKGRCDPRPAAGAQDFTGAPPPAPLRGIGPIILGPASAHDRLTLGFLSGSLSERGRRVGVGNLTSTGLAQNSHVGPEV